MDKPKKSWQAGFGGRKRLELISNGDGLNSAGKKGVV